MKSLESVVSNPYEPPAYAGSEDYTDGAVTWYRRTCRLAEFVVVCFVCSVVVVALALTMHLFAGASMSEATAILFAISALLGTGTLLATVCLLGIALYSFIGYRRAGKHVAISAAALVLVALGASLSAV